MNLNMGMDLDMDMGTGAVYVIRRISHRKGLHGQF